MFCQNCHRKIGSWNEQKLEIEKHPLKDCIAKSKDKHTFLVFEEKSSFTVSVIAKMWNKMVTFVTIFFFVLFTMQEIYSCDTEVDEYIDQRIEIKLSDVSIFQKM